jgi:DNA-binding NarL/FixJ family response regulator
MLADMGISFAPYRVLLVDDMPAVCEALTWAIEAAPELKVVGQVGDGLAALAAASHLHPDIVILDIELPHLNGYQVAQKLKQAHNSPLIVFLTVHADDVSRYQALTAGGDAFVEKGQGWPILISEIRQLLSSRSNC